MSRIVLFTEHSNSAPDPVSRSAFLRGRVIGLWLFGLCASLAGPSLTAQDWRASSVPGPSPAVCMKLGPVSPAAGPLTHAKVANVETGKNALPPGTYSFVSIDYSVASWTIFDGINDFGWISGWFNFILCTFSSLVLRGSYQYSFNCSEPAIYVALVEGSSASPWRDSPPYLRCEGQGGQPASD